MNRLSSRRGSAAAALLVTAMTAGTAAAQTQDLDGDGITDAADVFPHDSRASAITFAPAQGVHGMLMIEDRWPRAGDLDFNDLVVGYNYALRRNAAGETIALRGTFDLLANGGSLDLGLGLHLPVPRSAAASVTLAIGGGAPVQLELLQSEPELTVRLTGNVRDLFDGTAGPINSDPLLQRSAARRLVIEIELAVPVAIDVAAAPFDLFAFMSGEPSHEIHRPEFAGTSLMNAALFRTGDDHSGVGINAGRSFVEQNGIPFVLLLPELAPYPSEGQPIAALFTEMTTWARSGGTQAANFYRSGVDQTYAFDGAAVPAAIATAPGVPRAVSAVAGSGQATVSWTAPASDGGAALTQYVVTVSPAAGVTGATTRASGTATSLLFSGLTNGTAYTFTVTAVNGLGRGPGAASAAAVPAPTTASLTAAASTYFTVPAGVTQLTVDLYGAQGGGNRAGRGARVQATLAVTPGEVLQVNVGGRGRQPACNGSWTYVGSGTGGFNGGGDAGGRDYPWNCLIDSAGAGGGGSDIRRSPYGLANRLVVAGGGGGQGSGNSLNGSPIGGAGGALGVSAASGGQAYAGSAGGGAGGAFNGPGGIAGTGQYSTHGVVGSAGAGGRGGQLGSYEAPNHSGGGGGGGWYGGGGGGFRQHSSGGAGGGGSSYVAAGNLAIDSSAGVQAGNGRVDLSW